MDFTAGIVRIRQSDNRPAGTGFVVANGLIVTCAHVVWLKDDRAHAQPQPERVSIEFQAARGKPYFAHRRNDLWRDLPDDIAFLELDGVLPPGVERLPLGSYNVDGPSEFNTYGYPLRHLEGLPIAGRITARTKNAGMTVLGLAAPDLDHGHSGAPVWDGEVVVGMVTARPPSISAGEMGEARFATPAEALTAVCRDLPLAVWVGGLRLPPLGDLPAPSPLPPGSRLPLPRNHDFTGREAELLALAEALLYDEAPAPTAVTHGIGGIGKTQLAVEFCHRYGRFLHGVHWIAADQNIDAEITACGLAMGLQPWPETLPEQVAATLHAWREQPQRLVVLDNLPDAQVLTEHLPRLSGPRVLVTSRFTDWPTALGVQPIRIEILPRSDSLALLRRTAPRLSNTPDADLDPLAQKLSDLPLSLTLAGAHLRLRPSLSIPAYLEELERLGGAVKQQALPPTLLLSLTEHEFNLYKTFLSTWDLLSESDALDRSARRLFLAAGFCAPNTPIPRAVFERLTQQPIAETPADPPTGDFDLALARLASLGLVELSAAGDGAPILHPLMAEFARHLAAGGPASPLPAVAAALNGLCYAANESGYPERFRPYLAHAQAVAEEFILVDRLHSAILFDNLGCYLLSIAEYALARKYLEEALVIRKDFFGESHPDTATSLNNLGRLNKALGNLPAAFPYYESALNINRKIFGKHHHRTASSLNNLGTLLQEMGDMEAARPYLEGALEISQATRGERHPATAMSLNNLGMLLQAMGDLPAARKYLELALAILRENLGESHPDTAPILDNLGQVLQDMGKLSAAREHYEQALAIRKENFGERHPDTAKSLFNLGGLFLAEGDRSAARQKYEQALAIEMNIFGEGHPDFARSLDNLGKLLHSMGDLSGALSYYMKALVIRRETLGEGDIDTAKSMNSLGRLLIDLGNLPVARQFLEGALYIIIDTFGEDHPDTAASLNNLGDLHKAMGDLPAARQYYERALAIRQGTLGERHPDTANSLNDLGMLFQAMGDLPAARPYLEQALAICRETLGERHPAVAMSLNNLGSLLYTIGDLPAARPYYEQALAIYKETLGERHPAVAASLNNLGLLLQDMGDLPAARPYYEQALAIRRETLGERHPNTALSLNNLGSLLQAMGDIPAARAYFEQAVSILEAALPPEHPDIRSVRGNLAALPPPGE